MSKDSLIHSFVLSIYLQNYNSCEIIELLDIVKLRAKRESKVKTRP